MGMGYLLPRVVCFINLYPPVDWDFGGMFGRGVKGVGEAGERILKLLSMGIFMYQKNSLYAVDVQARRGLDAGLEELRTSNAMKISSQAPCHCASLFGDADPWPGERRRASRVSGQEAQWGVGGWHVKMTSAGVGEWPHRVPCAATAGRRFVNI